MKRSAGLLFLLLVLLFSIAFNGAYASSNPYWLKKGTIIEYYVNATQTTTWGGSAQYSLNGGCIYAIDFQQVFLRFSFINVSDSWVYVKVSIEFLGRDSTRGVFSHVNVVYPSSCKPLVGPLINTTTFISAGKLVKDSLYKKLIISGEYKLFLRNGTVYSMNGTYYGHTLLFGLYPDKRNNLIAVINGKKLLPEKIVSLNITYVTYLQNYTGPNVLLKYPPAMITTPTGENATTRVVAVFNPSNDITLGMMGSIPDLEAVGVNLLIAFDNMVQKFNNELSGSSSSPESLGKYPAPGVILYALRVPKTETHVTNPINNEIQARAVLAKPESSLWPIAVGMIGIAILIGVLIVRRNGK